MINYVPKEPDHRPSMCYQEPINAYERGKNWCISVPYHDLRIIEEVKVLAKKRNCKSVAQLVRKVIWNEIQLEKELQAA